MSDEKNTNRLIDEKSPYLLQHAHNPVDWHAWGEEAFALAKRQDKPIFLSIGYSTCHWCHVMAHESFEDPKAAAALNEVFVPIKVDREERPDIDALYMNVCQMMTGGGGWPLTIMMSPEAKPFFAATYIPKESYGGRAGLVELARRVGELWQKDRRRVEESADQVLALLARSTQAPQGQAFDEAVLETAWQQLSSRFDPEQGGFGRQPKFPTPHNLQFLLRRRHRTQNPAALEMVEKTLLSMRMGGLYDQIGYGFHRYSTDREWLVPHFEKMLYDQALLAVAYLEAFQATGKDIYRQTAREIFTYVLRDMTDPAGGFYSAEDADSEGEEGKFYLWTQEEINRRLGAADAGIFNRVFQVEPDGNFHQEHSGQKTGANILHLAKPLSETAQELSLPEEQLRATIERARNLLFAAREKRPRPHRDDKVLTDWNGLMIAALAKGARLMGNEDLVVAARRSAMFILEKMRKPDGGLLHRYRHGEGGIDGGLDDYAFFIWGLLELYETTFEVEFLKQAMELNRYLLDHFLDREKGGFFMTADDAETLLIRPKDAYDGALPSGNSVAALNLIRLARIAADPELEKRAVEIEQAFASTVLQMPSGFTHLLLATDFRLGPSFEVVIAGDPLQEETKDFLARVENVFLPNKVVLLRPAGESFPAISAIAGYTKDQTAIDGRATAYICRDHQCQLPTTDIEQMERLLSPGGR